MICNFCGSTLDDNELECPYCGHKTEVQPQVVSSDDFDDESVSSRASMFNKRREQAAPVEEYYEEEEEYEEPAPRSSKRASFSLPKSNGNVKSMGSFPLFLMSAASALLSLICLISVISANGRIKNMEQDLLSQFYQLQSSNAELSSKIDSVSGSVSAVGTTISESNNSRNITISQQPTSESTYLDRGSENDVNQNVAIFRAAASGAMTGVEWQIKVGDEWVALSWDENSNNETYGLHVYNDIGPSQTKTELCAHGVKQSAFATYRCVFIDSYGNKATDPVTLTERAA